VFQSSSILAYLENPTVPPVKVSVTKEKIQPDSGSGKTRLRYPSVQPTMCMHNQDA